jgi:hypothetical protein
MSRWQQDAVDFACEAWAYQWVSLFGREPRKASEYLGRLACTLSLVRVLADGAGSGTVVEQHYPEGFLGEGLLVNSVIKRMPEAERELLWRHYVDRWYILRAVRTKSREVAGYEPLRLLRPVKQGLIAQRMGISRSEYHRRRDVARSFVRGALAGEKCRDSKVGAREPGILLDFGQVQ